MGYGVIGSPTDSGSVSLGSSPGTPAPQPLVAVLYRCKSLVLAPSSSGPGRRPPKAVAPVRIRSGLQTEVHVVDVGLSVWPGVVRPSAFACLAWLGPAPRMAPLLAPPSCASSP